MNLSKFIQSLGYEIPEYDVMMPYINSWKGWYEGYVKAFHNYNIYSGVKTHKMQRYYLGMAKKVCENYADFLLNEKVKISIGEGEMPKGIRKILDENDFESLANESIEKVMGYGTGAFVLSLQDIEVDSNTGLYRTSDAKLKIEFATADKVIPLTYRGKKVTECAFAVNRTVGNEQLVYLSLHLLENGQYVIHNYLLKNNKGNLIDVSDRMEDTARDFPTGSDQPWFAIIRPAIVNNVSLDGPYGMSIFGNAIEILKGVDIAYDGFVWEFILGRKRIFVDADLLTVDGVEGELKYAYDVNDIVYYTLPNLANEEKTKIHETEFELRVDEYEKGIQLGLNLLSEKVGLGGGYYQWDKSGVKTATEVISENSDLYRSIQKQTIAIENALYDLFRGILYIAKTYLNLEVNIDDSITINFDDSIIEDTTTIRNQALLELNNGLISKIQYYQRVYGFDELQATDFFNKMQSQIAIGLEQEPSEDA